MSIDLLIKLLAGAGAAVLAASAVLPPLLKSKANAPATEGGVLVLPEPANPTAADAHAVLDIAERLRASGNVEGAKVAHQLIDLILAGPAPKG